jgi:hypothetical protein
MSTHLDHDPERDESLAALLRDAAEPVPAMDWDAMRTRIAAAAELPLARARRRAQPRRGSLLRALLPLAAAAGIAGGYVALRPAPSRDGDQAMVDEMVAASLPETVDQLISGEAAQGALLEVVAGS